MIATNSTTTSATTNSMMSDHQQLLAECKEMVVQMPGELRQRPMYVESAERFADLPIATSKCAAYGWAINRRTLDRALVDRLPNFSEAGPVIALDLAAIETISSPASFFADRAILGIA